MANSLVREPVERPTAIVMNMFYTGLGIARTLGERGIPVVGLSATSIYGNYTRYAEVRRCPDSREEPERLLAFLLGLGEELPFRSMIFPTRDDDVLFLDRYRAPLGRHFDVVIPRADVVTACLDKWETHLWAQKAGIAAPRCWMVQNPQEMAAAADQVPFPCVMKPLSSHLWRRNGNWQRVGARKAVGIANREELLREYAQISQADPRVLIQEMVPGADDQLFVVACYVSRESRLVAAFTARKLLQIPAGFGTGCIVQTVDRDRLVESAAQLLQTMGFTGIAEVEFKWDAASGCNKLIEVNPRPWDQHFLGRACGVDLIYLAYCDYAGAPLPAVRAAEPGYTWIADDAFLMATLRAIWTRKQSLRSLFRLTRGKRVHAIWCGRDKRPFFMYMAKALPNLIRILLWRSASALFHGLRSDRGRVPERGLHGAKTKG